MPRYNIALLPKIHHNTLLQLASTFHDNPHIDYLLGEHSLPHITLVQFRTDAASINDIWINVQTFLHQIQFHTITLELSGLDGYISPTQPDYIWLQLLPNEIHALRDLHKNIVQILKEKNLIPLNRSLDHYEPHLTLIHTPNFSHLTSNKSMITLSDTFYLALGESDEMGQFKKIIHCFER